MKRMKRPRETTMTSRKFGTTLDWGRMSSRGREDDSSTRLHAGGSPMYGSRTAAGDATASSQHALDGSVGLSPAGTNHST